MLLHLLANTRIRLVEHQLDGLLHFGNIRADDNFARPNNLELSYHALSAGASVGYGQDKHTQQAKMPAHVDGLLRVARLGDLGPIQVGFAEQGRIRKAFRMKGNAALRGP